MSICVAVTDNNEGASALHLAAAEAGRLGVRLVAVNLTASDLDTASLAPELDCEVVVPAAPTDLDEVGQVLAVVSDRPDVTLIVVGVRKRSALGKAVLGSIPQRLILDATVPVLSVKTTDVAAAG